MARPKATGGEGDEAERQEVARCGGARVGHAPRPPGARLRVTGAASHLGRLLGHQGGTGKSFPFIFFSIFLTFVLI